MSQRSLLLRSDISFSATRNKDRTWDVVVMKDEGKLRYPDVESWARVETLLHAVADKSQ